jgi:hypothetical protein
MLMTLLSLRSCVSTRGRPCYCSESHRFAAAARAASSFDKFVGVWRGAGQIVGTNGHRGRSAVEPNTRRRKRVRP